MAACIAMNRLPDSAIRLLGSTQVITSVYSVIKELLENSFDAGATSVEIKLENYGLDKIEVRDNGCGIKTADVQVFAKRHFTSKIASHADLEALTTYGFRGEALASLCAVSEVSVTTKTAADDISLTYTLDCEGSIVSTTPSHLGQGTTVCAKNLFKNLPVRKQYHSMVKKKKEDLKNVENLLLSYGVILPKVRFTLRHNKEMIWQKVVLENTAAVLQSILGKGVVGQMEWSQKVVEDLGMTLELCVPKPGSDVSSLSRSACDRSFLCINSRPVAVKEIDKLIRQYYSNCHACEMSRHPVYYLGITLPAKDLDVNIDPNKTTVMTTNMKLLREQLEEMLLCIYGPLDEAPSWRYRDADNGKSKTSASKPDDNNMSTSLLEHLKKTCTDFGDPVTQCSSDCNSNKEKEPKGEQMPAEAVAVVREVTPAQKTPAEENVGRPCGNGRCPDWNQHVHGMDRTEVSLGVNTSMPSGADSKAGPLKIIPGNSSLQEPQGNCSAVMQNVGLASDTSGEVSGTLPHNLPEDVGKNSKESAAPSNNLLPELTVVANKDHCASMCKNEGKGTKGHSGNGFEGPREGLSAAEVKVTGEGEKESRSHSEETQVAGTSGWSHGTSVKSADGATVQPVCLLAPASAKLASKRPLSPSHDQQIQKEMAAPEKRGRRLCPAQSTLYDMINNTAVKRPLTAREFFMKEKRSSVVEQNPQADYDEVTDILAKMWDELAGETRISFLEKCWSDTHRYNKELAAAKTVVGKVKTSAAGRHKPQVSVRDMVAVASTQPSPQPAGKRRVKSSTMATNMPFSMTLLRSSLSLAAPSSQVHFPGVQVLASLPSCKTWVCGRGSELCILNIHRLSEAMVYQRLLSQHCLPVHHCQPVRLTPSNTGGYWSVLQKLAESHLSLDAFSHLSDRRLAANGLDVKCWKDTEGQLCVELVGVCGDVPTYGVDDLVEILELVSNSTSSSLLHSRPLKVLNYLKGEAVRMVRQQAGERSMEEVQDLLEEGARLLPADCSTCLHGRPFFHTLLPDIDTTAASQESTESLPDLADGSERGGRCTSRESLSGNDSLGEGAEKSKEGWEMKWTFGDDSMDQVMSLDDLMDSE